MFNAINYLLKDCNINNPAIIGNNVKITYGDLIERIDAISNWLKEKGIKKSDVVVVLMNKSTNIYDISLGIIKAGAIFCPIFSTVGKDALKLRLDDCKPSMIIIDEDLCNRKFNDIMKNYLRATIAEIEKWVSNPINCKPYIADTTKLDTMTLHYTSGTTGNPKGVLHSHGDIIRYVKTAKEVFNLSNNDIYWCTADHAWITGSTYGIMAPLGVGATIVEVSIKYKFTDLLKIINDFNINIWYTAPTLLKMLRNEYKCNRDIIKSLDDMFKSLRGIYCVGEILSKELSEWVVKTFNTPVIDTWFQTETGSIVVANNDSNKLGILGKPLKDVKLGILDDCGNEVAKGEIGHLCIHKSLSSLFSGYLNKNEIYFASFIGDWYKTGDKVSFDKDENLLFYGRADDIINTAGHLISPLEIENIINKVDEVKDVAIIGVPDDKIGEKIIAYVVKSSKSDETKLNGKIRKQIRNDLFSYAVPSHIIYLNKLPKTQSGKIMRNYLKKELIMNESKEQNKKS